MKPQGFLAIFMGSTCTKRGGAKVVAGADSGKGFGGKWQMGAEMKPALSGRAAGASSCASCRNLSSSMLRDKAIACCNSASSRFRRASSASELFRPDHHIGDQAR